jgi:hypothetical protein
MLHEFGHAFGLTEENFQLATMNASHPFGGPLGNYHFVQPHGDDMQGMRALYGSTTQRDLVASAYKFFGDPATTISLPTTSIQAGHSADFTFTIENRGTTSSSVPVGFYLSASPDKVITTTDTPLTTTSTYALGSGAYMTQTVPVQIPANTPPGTYYFGYIVDPLNTVSNEYDDGMADSAGKNDAVPIFGSTLTVTAPPPPSLFFYVEEVAPCNQFLVSWSILNDAPITSVKVWKRSEGTSSWTLWITSPLSQACVQWTLPNTEFRAQATGPGGTSPYVFADNLGCTCTPDVNCGVPWALPPKPLQSIEAHDHAESWELFRAN